MNARNVIMCGYIYLQAHVVENANFDIPITKLISITRLSLKNNCLIHR